MDNLRLQSCLLVVLAFAPALAIAQPAPDPPAPTPETPVEQPEGEPQPGPEPAPPVTDPTAPTGPKIDFRDGFVISSDDEAFKLRVQGRVHFDGRWVPKDENAAGGDPTNSMRLRRWRIETTGRLFTNFEWIVQVEFAGNTASLQDAWLDINYHPALKIRFGQYRLPFGLEQDTSDNWVKFIERSIVTNFLTPSYDVGVMVFGDLFAKRIGYFASMSNGNGLASQNNNDAFDYAGRLVLRPFVTAASALVKGLQLGGAVVYGAQTGTALQSTGPQTQLGTRLFAFDMGTTLEGKRLRLGAELSYHAGPLEIVGEVITMKHDVVDMAGTTTEVSFLGWQAGASFYFTGEDNSAGRPKVKKPVGGGGIGALNLAARFAQLEATDVDPVSTGLTKATEIVVGPNWYPNTALRINLNYELADFEDGLREHAGMFRVQLIY
jgi:phosphate-selective porin OprO/OprP